MSEPEEQQWYSPSLDLVLKEVEGLHTNTVLMLAKHVVVITADLQRFKVVLQSENMFGCIYIYTPPPHHPVRRRQTRLLYVS